LNIAKTKKVKEMFQFFAKNIAGKKRGGSAFFSKHFPLMASQKRKKKRKRNRQEKARGANRGLEYFIFLAARLSIEDCSAFLFSFL
jgi:hypothetical protein